MNFKSQIGQDAFVVETLQGKRCGTFVDIGGGHPIEINNTYALEKEYGWVGVSYDVGPPYTHACERLTLEQYQAFWGDTRTTPLVCTNALTVDYSKSFKDSKLPNNIDYLSLDLEPPWATFECLKRIPFDEYTFNVITFETDFYRDGTTREPSRDFLLSRGYTLVRSCDQEDWYVNNR